MSTKIPTHDHSPDATVQLYSKRTKIHPRSIQGRFEVLRKLGAYGFLLLFVGVAWIQWQGRQGLLFDLPHRRFYLFGLTIWPQDLILLSWFLIIAAFALFAVTVFAGRVWCGYTCPQTIWTKIFIAIESFIEGDRNARMRLDKADLTWNKVWRRGLKHLGWIGVSFLTGMVFVGYFAPIRELIPALLHGQANASEWTWIGIFTAATYVNAGWMREQICMYACPYGRFQSVMFDRDTLIISYDHARGEPRGARKRDADPRAQALGDCIDCQLCVQVCPTGIDIRDGLQFECIACAACIDACDKVMEQMGYAPGLVRYTSENALEHGQHTHILRPRLLGYSAAISVMIGLMVYDIATRPPVGLDVIRDRNALYRETSDGDIENSYILNVMNKSQQPEHVDLSFSHMPQGTKMEGRQSILLQPGEMRSVTETLDEDPDDLKNNAVHMDFHARVEEDPGVDVDSPSRFFAPYQHRN